MVGSVQFIPNMQVTACFQSHNTITARQLLHVVIGDEYFIILKADRALDGPDDIAGTVVEAHPGLVVEQAGALLARLLVIRHIGAQVVAQVVRIVLDGLDRDEAVAPHIAHGVVIVGVGHIRGLVVEEQQAMQMPRAPALLLLDVQPFETAIGPLHAAHEAPEVAAYAAVVLHVGRISQRDEPHVLGHIVIAIDDFLHLVESPFNATDVVGFRMRLILAVVKPYLGRAAYVVAIIVDAVDSRLPAGLVLAQGDVGGVAAIDQLDMRGSALERVIRGHYRYSLSLGRIVSV